MKEGEHLDLLRRFIDFGIGSTFLGLQVEEFDSKYILRFLHLLKLASTHRNTYHSNPDQFYSLIKAHMPKIHQSISNLKEFKQLTKEYFDSDQYVKSLFSGDDTLKLNKVMDGLVMKKSS